jgi:transposase
VVDGIRLRYKLLEPVMDERVTRLWAAAEAQSHGRGGAAAVTEATGIPGKRIWMGAKELDELEGTPSAQPPLEQRVRRRGGGRKALEEKDPQLVEDLKALVEPASRGDPMSPLRWTTKSTRKLADELTKKGHTVSHDKVARLLAALDFSLQSTRKTKEGGSHPDRNAQFEHINEQAKALQARGQPVISVDTKKKELVGEFKNGGREWQPKGEPEKVQVYDFPDPEKGKAIPYGVYDLTRNEGWVNVGTDHDTSEFAVESIRRWWHKMGRVAYPEATELFMTADGGGSNGHRVRLWKATIQALADETGLRITVSHYPPGTSKWNKIEHRLFSQITENWRGRPLISHEVIVSLIGSTTTETGLRVTAGLDTNKYPLKKKVPKKEFEELLITKDEFHGEWNYTISPRAK